MKSVIICCSNYGKWTHTSSTRAHPPGQGGVPLLWVPADSPKPSSTPRMKASPAVPPTLARAPQWHSRAFASLLQRLLTCCYRILLTNWRIFVRILGVEFTHLLPSLGLREVGARLRPHCLRPIFSMFSSVRFVECCPPFLTGCCSWIFDPLFLVNFLRNWGRINQWSYSSLPRSPGSLPLWF